MGGLLAVPTPFTHRGRRTSPMWFPAGVIPTFQAHRQSPMLAALLVGLSAQSSSTSVIEAQRVSFRVSRDVSDKFGRSGAVALRSVILAPSAPLQRLGCPCTLEEFVGTARECRFASALACALLRCDAVCDLVGEWGAASHLDAGTSIDAATMPASHLDAAASMPAASWRHRGIDIRLSEH